MLLYRFLFIINLLSKHNVAYDKLIKVGNKKLIPKDVNDLLIKYFSSTQQPKNNADAAGNLPLIEQLRSEIEAEKGTVTQLLASNYNLSNKLAELEAPKEDNESLDTTKDALNETKEELESLRKQLEETRPQMTFRKNAASLGGLN